MSTMFYTQIESPLGPLLLAADDAGLRQILFVNGRRPARPESSIHATCTFGSRGVAAPGNLKFAETLPRGNLPRKKMAMPPSLMLVIVAFSFWPSPDPSVAGISTG